jgi:AraC-like DNA-binding protein
MRDLFDLHELDFISPYVRHALYVKHFSRVNTWLSNEMEHVLLYIVRGSFIHTVDGFTTELSEGMLRIIPPYANQIVGEATSEHVEFYCVYFDLFDCEESRRAVHRDHDRHLPERELFFKKHHTLGLVGEERRENVMQHLDFIVRHHSSAPGLTANIRLKAAMLSVLAEFFCAKPLNRREEHDVSSLYVSRALHYVDHNFAVPTLSVTEIAAHLGISTAHLSRLVKRGTGQTLSEYITSVRLRKAKDLFALGNRVSDVAAECGFLSLQSFSRTFRRVEGISPRAYLSSPDRQKSADSAEKI